MNILRNFSFLKSKEFKGNKMKLLQHFNLKEQKLPSRISWRILAFFFLQTVVLVEDYLIELPSIDFINIGIFLIALYCVGLHSDEQYDQYRIWAYAYAALCLLLQNFK